MFETQCFSGFLPIFVLIHFLSAKKRACGGCRPLRAKAPAKNQKLTDLPQNEAVTSTQLPPYNGR
jgi:hypothetical protein